MDPIAAAAVAPFRDQVPINLARATADEHTAQAETEPEDVRFHKNTSLKWRYRRPEET
jgi:hypothetical protein